MLLIEAREELSRLRAEIRDLFSDENEQSVGSCMQRVEDMILEAEERGYQAGYLSGADA